jgi:hypothetical protein
MVAVTILLAMPSWKLSGDGKTITPPNNDVDRSRPVRGKSARRERRPAGKDRKWWV